MLWGERSSGGTVLPPGDWQGTRALQVGTTATKHAAPSVLETRAPAGLKLSHKCLRRLRPVKHLLGDVPLLPSVTQLNSKGHMIPSERLRRVKLTALYVTCHISLHP